MMHVLHLLRALRTGGLENVVVNLVNGLQRHPDVQCSVGCLIEQGEWSARVAPRGVWVGDLEQRGALRTLLSLSRHIRKNGVQLIHSHNSQAHLFGVAASLLTGIPLVHTKHGQNWPDDPRWVWKSRQASRLSRRIIAVSSDIRRIIVDIENVPEDKVVLIQNGIDTSEFLAVGENATSGAASAPTAHQCASYGYPCAGSPLAGDHRAESPPAGDEKGRLALGLPADAFVIGSVGRLAWEKNYELLVRAFAAFLGRHPEGFLVIVGEGPYCERIEAAVLSAGIRGRCLLAGIQGDVKPWLQAMDIYCLSSLTEGASITLLEAAAAGLPAVVTNVGGNAEIVRDGVNGLVVLPKDAVALSAAFERLHRDPDERGRMGLAARARVTEQYSVERMVDAYLRLYREVLGSGS